MEEMSCDVLVIGAGPAGSTAARVAAENGARVLLLERRAQIGVPIQCAGYVAKPIRWHVSLPDECIAQSVDGLCTLLPDGTVQETRAPGYTLNRAALDRHLAQGAVEAGARLLLKTPAVGRWEGGVVARRDGRRVLIRARVIIGADGPRSLVARWMGLAQPRLIRALQYEVTLRRRLSLAKVYFRRALRGGYAWLFPSGETARVGAAFVDGGEGIAALTGLLQELEEGEVIGSTLSFTAGFVPVSGPIGPCRDNMLLVGDAAGHAHPITGAGILNAIMAGDMAGRAAAQAALASDLGLLGEYEEEWRQVLGPTLDRALEKRCRLERKWDSSPAELSRTIRQSWVTFDEYYSC